METIEYKGYQIKLEQDIDGDSPRKWDNMGKMLCFHERYNDLGDKHDITSNDFNGWDTVKDYLSKKLKAVLIFPLYLYDHSGLRMKIGSFQGHLPEGHAEFDSGQVGFIYITAKGIRENFMVKRITKKIRARAEKNLIDEVEILDQFLSGDVYHYNIEKDGKSINSSGSCYDYDYTVKECKVIVDGMIKRGKDE